MASQLNRGDGRNVVQLAQGEGKSAGFCKHLKNTVNLVYNWGIEEHLIAGVTESPCAHVVIEKDREGKIPESLTVEEIRTLLRLAREQGHPWYPIWVMAALTGCRSGELQSLKVADVELVTRETAVQVQDQPADKRHYGFIRIRRSWNCRLKQVGPTKAGYWRTVPVSSELYWFFLDELKITEKFGESPCCRCFRNGEWVCRPRSCGGFVKPIAFRRSSFTL